MRRFHGVNDGPSASFDEKGFGLSVPIVLRNTDALVHAWGTLYTGFILDALVLIGNGIANPLGQHEVTTEAFRIALLILATKSLLTALGSYILRLKSPP